MGTIQDKGKEERLAALPRIGTASVEWNVRYEVTEREGKASLIVKLASTTTLFACSLLSVLRDLCLSISRTIELTLFSHTIFSSLKDDLLCNQE